MNGPPTSPKLCYLLEVVSTHVICLAILCDLFWGWLYKWTFQLLLVTSNSGIKRTYLGHALNHLVFHTWILTTSTLFVCMTWWGFVIWQVFYLAQQQLKISPPEELGGRWEDNNGITHCCRRLKSILERTLHMMIFLHIAIFLETFIMPRLPCASQTWFSFFPCGR